MEADKETNRKKGLRRLVPHVVASVLALTLALGSFWLLRPSADEPGDPGTGGSDPGNSSIVPEASAKDVFVNVDQETLARLGVTAQQFSDMLKQYIIDNGNGAYNAENVNVANNVTVIDTTNLDKWYVYDHYDTNATGVTADGALVVPWDASDARFQTTEPNKTLKMRDYFSYAETKYKTNAGKLTTIEALMKGWDTLSVFSATSKDSANSRPLREHIYSYTTPGSKPNQVKANMTFMGYGGPGSSNNGYTDFLFYPTDSTYTKNIEFDINSADVRTHSLGGAGFLLNAGVDASGNIHGYVLYMQFFAGSRSNTTQSPAYAKMALYEIKTGILASKFHNDLYTGTTTGKVAQASTYTKLVVSAVNSDGSAGAESGNSLDYFKASDSAAIYDSMHISIVFDDTDLVVKTVQLDAGGNPVGTPLQVQWNGKAEDFTKLMTASSYHSFGPLVDYVAHNCSSTSAYTFSNLSMKFTTDPFKPMMDYSYKTGTNVDRYFVNLVEDPIDEGSTGYWPGIGRLRQDKIFYITNNENTVITDKTGDWNTGGSNGDNGLNLKTPDDPLTELIKKIGNYIINTPPWTNDALPPVQDPTPQSRLTPLGKDATLAAPVPIKKLEKQNLIGLPLQVYVGDLSTIWSPGGDARLDKIIVKWWYPNAPTTGAATGTATFTGAQFTQWVDGTDSEDGRPYSLFLLDENAQVGEYTITLQAFSGALSGGIVTRTFIVIQDTLPPKADISSGDHDNIYGGLYKQNHIDYIKLWDNANESDWGVTQYQIGYSNQADGSDMVWTTANPIALTNPDRWLSWDSPDLLWDGTKGADGKPQENDLRHQALYFNIKVWDWVGHTYLYTLPIAPYQVSFDWANSLNIAKTDMASDAFPTTFDGLARWHTWQQAVTIPAPPANQKTADGLYQVIGYTTDKTSNVPMTGFTVTSDTVLYPCFKYLAGGSIELAIVKNTVNRDARDGQFRFNLSEDIDGVDTFIKSVTNTGAGAETDVSFGTIYYTQDDVGTHVYTITETPTGGAWTTADTAITVAVTVAHSGLNDGRLNVTAAYTRETYTNTREIFANLPVSVTVSTVGKDLEDQQFNFTIYDPTDMPIKTVYNDADGKVSFDDIGIANLTTGDYTYRIEQNGSDGNGWTLDKKTVLAYVNVAITEDPDHLGDPDYDIVTITVTYEPPVEDGDVPEFVNVYATDPVSAQIDAATTAEGAAMAAGQFTFNIYDAKGDVIATAANLNAGAASPAIAHSQSFSAAGRYVYTLREEAYSTGGWTSDAAEYTAVVTVTDNGNGTMSAVVAYYDQEGVALAEAPVFRNVYVAPVKPKPDVPSTGDNPSDKPGDNPGGNPGDNPIDNPGNNPGNNPGGNPDNNPGGSVYYPPNSNPGGGTTGSNTPGNGTTGSNTPGNGTTGNNTPGNGTTGNNTPGNGTTGSNTPGNGTTGNNTPGTTGTTGNTPDGNVPGTTGNTPSITGNTTGITGNTPGTAGNTTGNTGTTGNTPGTPNSPQAAPPIENLLNKLKEPGVDLTEVPVDPATVQVVDGHKALPIPEGKHARLYKYVGDEWIYIEDMGIALGAYVFDDDDDADGGGQYFWVFEEDIALGMIKVNPKTGDDSAAFPILPVAVIAVAVAVIVTRKRQED